MCTYSTVQHSTAQHSTVQQCGAERSEAQYSIVNAQGSLLDSGGGGLTWRSMKTQTKAWAAKGSPLSRASLPSLACVHCTPYGFRRARSTLRFTTLSSTTCRENKGRKKTGTKTVLYM